MGWFAAGTSRRGLLCGRIFLRGGLLRGLQLDRGPRPLVDLPLLGAQQAPGAEEADLDVEGPRGVDVVAFGKGVGNDVCVEQDMVAGRRFERHAAAVGQSVGFCREVRPDFGDLRGRRDESRAAVVGVETSAHQRGIVAPPRFVAAFELDFESFLHVAGVRGAGAASARRAPSHKDNAPRRAGQIYLRRPGPGALNLGVFFANILFFSNFAH